MTHIYESDFANDYAFPWLQEQFPTASVEPERWVGGTGGFADAWVTLPGDGEPAIILAVEFGNDSGVRNDAAQAIEYASNDDRAVPYVIVPSNHADAAVVDAFRARGVIIVELDTHE